MAVSMLLAGEGVTEDSYRQLTEAMFGNYPMRGDQSPEGLILHTAGQSGQGWYVYDIWESREHFQRFVEATLGPCATGAAVLRHRDAGQGLRSLTGPPGVAVQAGVSASAVAPARGSSASRSEGAR
jgi:hypothetical protein